MGVWKTPGGTSRYSKWGSCGAGAASSSTNSEIVDPRPFLCDKGAWLTGSAQWLTTMPPPKRHRSGGLPNGHLQLPGARFSSKKVG
jgi:hypothetical protein